MAVVTPVVPSAIIGTTGYTWHNWSVWVPPNVNQILLQIGLDGGACGDKVLLIDHCQVFES